MKPLGDRNDHFWLAQRMAKCTQVDLVAAMQRAALSQEDWAEMVEHCRGCAWGAGCGRWLNRHDRERPQITEEVPGACVNRERFAKIKAALEAQD